MNYQLSELENGVRVLTVPIPSLESATITVWVKTGSSNEDKRVLGISHFLEHMVFKGSPRYPGAKIVAETIDSLGAENNAGTTKEWTNFYIKTASINLEKAFDVLADVTLNPMLKEEEIERERGVIYEEIAMYEDTPMMSIGEHFEEVIYQGTPLAWKIAGGRDSLVKINHNEFEKYRSEKYHPENIIISVAGGVKEEKVEELARKYFSSLQGPTPQAHKSTFKGSTLQGRTLKAEDRFYLKSKKSDQAHLILGFLAEGRGYKGRFAQGILASILGKGMSSRLFTEVREKRGLAYAVHATFDRYSSVGNFDVYAGVTISKTDDAINIIKEELFKIRDKKDPVTKTELTKAKNYIKGKLALSLEDSSSVGDFFAEQVMFDKEILTPKELYERIDKVDVDEVYYEAGKVFKDDGMYLAVIGPFEDKNKFVNLVRTHF